MLLKKTKHQNTALCLINVMFGISVEGNRCLSLTFTSFWLKPGQNLFLHSEKHVH